MELHYSPFACSLAAHIITREVGLDVTLRRVDLPTKRVEGGRDLFGLNPMGQVPTLVLDDGQVLTENVAVLTFLADRAPELRLLPEERSLARYQALSWISFVATEIHKKVLWPIFAPDTPPAVKDFARASAQTPLSRVERHLSSSPNLVGNAFGVADSYLVWALVVLPFGGVALDPFPLVSAYLANHLTRSSVRAALAHERHANKVPFAV